MDEVWKPLFEFPQYIISTYGDIVNTTNGRPVRQSKTLQGALKVNLYDRGHQCTRSVKVLVADTFVRKPRSMRFNSPIQKDNNPLNVRADNLLWRTRPFAWKYHEQFKVIADNNIRRCSVIEVTEGVHYESVYDAAVDNGLLFIDIRKSAFLFSQRDPYPTVHPTGQVFSIHLKREPMREGIATLSQQGINM